MKIKILHIQETISSGGVERTRLSLAKLLDKSKFEQKIICTCASGNISEEIKKEGVEIIPIGVLRSPFQLSHHKKVQKIIEEFKPDIIHGAVFEGVTMAAVNGFIKKVPVIIIEETSDPQNRSWRGNLLMKIFAKLAHRVIGVSEAVTEEYLKGKLYLPPNKVVLVNNGVALPREVSTEEFRVAKIKWGISDNDFIIGSAGRMLQDEHKRFSDLIRSFEIFAKDKENVKLLLVGDGKEKAGYEKLAIQLNIECKVIFTGYQSDVSLFYKMMSIFSLVSAREAFGLVLAEAMLNKLPVIATSVGGMKYIVQDKVTGFLVEPRNIEQIAENFEKLYHNKELRTQFGDNSYKRALEKFTEVKYAEKIAELYLSQIKTRKK